MDHGPKIIVDCYYCNCKPKKYFFEILKIANIESPFNRSCWFGEYAHECIECKRRKRNIESQKLIKYERQNSYPRCLYRLFTRLSNFRNNNT